MTSAPGDGGGQRVAGGLAGGLVEVGERGEFAHAGLLGGGAQRVARGVRRVVELAADGQSGDRVEVLAAWLPGTASAASSSAAGRRRPARRRSQLGGARRVPWAARGGVFSASCVGEAVQAGDGGGVRLVGLDRGALAGERCAAD